jgi:hypothetical protein
MLLSTLGWPRHLRMGKGEVSTSCENDGWKINEYESLVVMQWSLENVMI